ncbi:hypothetical protein CEW46_28605 [Bacillus cereus]|nr:hypothetical protein CEW46_28605 [Bacillus cereus]
MKNITVELIDGSKVSYYAGEDSPVERTKSLLSDPEEYIEIHVQGENHGRQWYRIYGKMVADIYFEGERPAPEVEEVKYVKLDDVQDLIRTALRRDYWNPDFEDFRIEDNALHEKIGYIKDSAKPMRVMLAERYFEAPNTLQELRALQPKPFRRASKTSLLEEAVAHGPIPRPEIGEAQEQILSGGEEGLLRRAGFMAGMVSTGSAPSLGVTRKNQKWIRKDEKGYTQLMVRMNYHPTVVHTYFELQEEGTLTWEDLIYHFKNQGWIENE